MTRAFDWPDRALIVSAVVSALILGWGLAMRGPAPVDVPVRQVPTIDITR